jgi:hypothetical protein
VNLGDEILSSVFEPPNQRRESDLTELASNGLANLQTFHLGPQFDYYTLKET